MTNLITARGPIRKKRKGVVAISAAVLIVGALTGCSSSGGDADGRSVDSLATGSSGGKGGAAGTASDSAVDAKRPQLRLDTSEEDEQRLTDAYNACLQAEGVPMAKERAAATGAKQAPPKQGLGDKYKDSFDACLVKLPRQPPETQPETNPAYADDFRAYVKCLQGQGMKVHMTPDTSDGPNGLTWTYDEKERAGLPEAQEAEAQRKCTVEAFDGKK
ncbi:hypothetical protein [Streptomyces tauricus]|uniref:hypothetical protein n=1 Tax=Streptomyces tauricus TaxID=68274 RepID=UPI0022444389|nr:hypothetical protein [Streptomyces tauricus]MCW8103323.1 hypothetical protein [Streptomyces tauricus]